MLIHPGAFVPNIQRFVSGLESVAKRLAISINEDSSVSDNKYTLILYAASLVAQAHKDWLPTDDQINMWFSIAVQAQSAKNKYMWETKDFTGQITVLNELSLSYILLTEVRSFPSDELMVGTIYQNQGKLVINDKVYRGIMPLIHCIDHHSFTDLAHYMPYTSTSYPQLFKQIWDKVSGVNPRKEIIPRYIETMEHDPFVILVRQAQRWLWITKIYTPQPRPVTSRQMIIEYRLDPSWISGLIGPIEVKVGHFLAIVVLRTDDIYTLAVVKKPRREDKTIGEFSEEEKLVANQSVMTMLKKGIPLTNTPTLSQLKGALVYLTEEDGIGQYWLKLADGTSHKWEEYINFRYPVPIMDPIPLPDWSSFVETAVLLTGDGFQENWESELARILATYSQSVLHRLIIYISGYNQEIQLYKISRTGEGQDYSVVPEDTAVNHILCAICVLCPAALIKTSSGFRVKIGPLMWKIRDIIIQYRSISQSAEWPPIIPDSRKMWEHQKESLDTLINRYHQGKYKNIIGIPVGLGKTMIVLYYLKYLQSVGALPRYIVYTLPPSALAGVKRELEYFQIPYREIDMRVGSEFTTLQPLVVNILFHDHMRLNGMHDQLKNHAENMLFIIDELHNTFNKSIRTSIALEISKLCHGFVAMSGTLISKSIEDVIMWLEQVVEFEVTKDNYWVAFSSLISKRVTTNIVVERVEIEVPMTDQQSKEYFRWVPPKLGGTANHINLKEAVNLCRDVITNQMLVDTIEYIRKGEVVFLVARGIDHQEEMAEILRSNGINNIHLITKDNPIHLPPDDPRNIQVIITTIRHSEGYTVTKSRVMITGVYFSNQNTRDQLEGRINRLSQTSNPIYVIIYHTGILTYVLKHYNKTRLLSESLKGFAKEIDLKDTRNLMNL